MNKPIDRWNTLITREKPTAELLKAIWFVAYTLSSPTRQTLSVARHRITRVPIADLASLASDGYMPRPSASICCSATICRGRPS